MRFYIDNFNFSKNKLIKNMGDLPKTGRIKDIIPPAKKRKSDFDRLRHFILIGEDGAPEEERVKMFRSQMEKVARELEISHGYEKVTCAYKMHIGSKNLKRVYPVQFRFFFKKKQET